MNHEMAGTQSFPLASKTLVPFLLLVIIVSIIESKHFHSVAGPFKIVIGRLERCPDKDPTQDQLSITYQESRSRYSPTFYSGNITMPFYLSDNLSARLTLASWDRVSGWKANAHKFHVDHLCRNMEFFIPHLYHTYMRGIYGDVPECYYLPGLYRFVNYSVSWEDIPVKHFFYGRWRADLEITHPEGKRAACVRGFAETVPK